MQNDSYKNFMKIAFWYLYETVSSGTWNLSYLWKYRKLSYPRLLRQSHHWLSRWQKTKRESLRHACILWKLRTCTRHPSGYHYPLFQLQPIVYPFYSGRILCRIIYHWTAMWTLWGLWKTVLQMAESLEFAQGAMAWYAGGFWKRQYFFLPDDHSSELLFCLFQEVSRPYCTFFPTVPS